MQKGDKVVIVDDVLATGGTLNAAIELLEKQGAEIAKILLLNQVLSCKGLEKLKCPK